MRHKQIVKEAGYIVNVKKIINKIKAISLAGLLMVCATPVVSLAAEPVKVELKVNVETNGEGYDKNETYTIELKDSNGKLLESKDVKEGDTKLSFDNLVYTSAGTHHYTISEKQGNTKGYTYDNKNVYNVTVHVVNQNDGKLGYSVTLNKLGTDTKSGSISFVNTYTRNKETSETPESPETPETPTPNTPPESQPETPSSEPESPSTPESSSEPESSSTPESSSEPESPSTPESSSEPESSSTPESSTTPESTTQPATQPVVPAPTLTPETPTQPSTTPATESPNRPSDAPRIEREEIPEIPVYEELVAEQSNPEYVNLAPDPVPLVSLTTLNDEETPKAVLIADEDVPLAVLTGDTFNMILWIALLAVSGIVIVLIFASKLRNRKNNK
jgi:pilin isopeptide linkage protein